jgi:hypothetical protein
MNAPWLLTAILAATLAARPTRAPAPPFENPLGSVVSSASSSKVDSLVAANLRRLGIAPAPPCSDAVFVRRVYLDVIGTLPTAAEARSFLNDRSPKKRRALVDQLLAKKEFADYWAMKWGDLLRIKSEYPVNLWPNAAQTYHRWIRTCLKENMPYDRFVREMLTSSGSNFDVPQVNFYRAVQGREPTAIAQAVALSFMGVRPAAWRKQQWAEMAVFFAQIDYKATEQWKEEIVLFNPEKTASTSSATASEAAFPDGTSALLTAGKDPREVFANWLTASKNPWFARNIVNRIWSWLLGRGIVYEPDDFRPDNPPANPELLAYLEHELVAGHYDLKRIYRLILNSRTYQASSIPLKEHPQGDANFARYVPRRLEAEVLIDAICQITGTTEEYTSAIPEPFTFIPENRRSIELADGSVGSSFLELFGRSPRDTGLESERNNRSTAAQQLHLLNSSHIRGKIEQSAKLQKLLQSGRKPREIVDDVYLTILSRFPTDEELKAIREYAEPGHSGRRPMVDLAWALFNSTEFLYRH